jgi:hypothetical protein
VFRCRSDDDYYRFFMNSAASCRRLVRRIAGTFTAQPGVGAGTVAAEKAKELRHLSVGPDGCRGAPNRGLSLRDIASS